MGAEEYVFTSSGHEQLKSVFRSIGEAAQQSANRSAKAWSASGRKLTDLERLALRVARAQQQTAQKEARAQQQAARQAGRVAEQAERAKTRAVEQAIRERGRLEAAANRRRIKAETDAQLVAMRRVEQLRRANERRRSGFGSAILGLGGSAVRGIAGSAMALGAGGLALGLYAGGKLVRESIGLQQRATRIAVQGGGDPRKLQQTIEAAAVTTPGARADDIAAGVERFVSRTGDVEAAQKFAKTMAEISVATGTAAEDVGDAMSGLFTTMEVKTPEEMRKAMAALAVSGKRGALEIKDLAEEMPRLAAAAKRFGLPGGAESVAVLGGIAQLSMKATGDPARAITGTEAMLRQITAKSPELKRMGVNVFDKAGNARDLRTLLPEIIAKVGGKDMVAKRVGLQKVFGDEGSRSAISTLFTAYADAVRDGKDGMEAMNNEIARATDVTGAEAEIKNDLNTMQKTSAAKLTAAWESMRVVVGEHLAPAIADALGKFGDMIAHTDPASFAAAMNVATAAVSGFAEFLQSLGILKIKRKSSTEAGIERAEAGIEGTQAKIDQRVTEARILARGKLAGAKGTREEIISATATPEEQQQLRSLSEQQATAAKAQSLAASQQLIGQTVERMFGAPKLAGIKETDSFLGLPKFEQAHVLGGGVSGAAGDISARAAEQQGGAGGESFTQTLKGEVDRIAAQSRALADEVTKLAGSAAKAQQALEKLSGTQKGNAAVL